MKFLKYKYKDYKKDIRTLANILEEESLFQSDHDRNIRLVSVYRGSLIPCVHLSNIIDIPLDIIKIQTRDGSSDIKWLTNPDFKETDKIFVIDDIYDTGKTMKKIKKVIPNMEAIVLFWNTKNTKELPKYVIALNQTDKWVKFWWEELNI